MRLAIVAVLAVGAVGLAIGGLTPTNADHIQPLKVTELCIPFGPTNTIVYTISNNIPLSANVTVEWPDGEQTKTNTVTIYAMEQNGGGSTDVPCDYWLEAEPSQKIGVHITNIEFLGPTGFYGTIQSYNIDKGGIEVIAVNVRDHSDVKRDITNSEGEWFIRTEPGDYLIQAIGGGSFAYQYTSLESIGLKRIDLIY